jgi:hypothetical protein
MPSSHDPVIRMFHCLFIVLKISLFSMPYSHDPVIGTNHIFKKCVYFFRATSKVTCGGELKYLFSCVDEDDWPCLVKNNEGDVDDLPDSESPELRIKANRFESNKT